MSSSRSRPLRAGGGALTHNADADLTSVRVSNIFPHQWAALHVEVESLVKNTPISGLRRIREGKPIMSHSIGWSRRRFTTRAWS
jgi:hypothetical protein